MYSITDLKKGTVIQIDNTPYRVLEYNHSSLGRGGAVVKTKLKNLSDGAVLTKTFRGNEKIASAEVAPVACQFLYQDQEMAHFMRQDNYEQIDIPKEVVSEQLSYLKEGMEVEILYVDQKPLSVELPIKIVLEVVSADPNVKGDSAGSVTKQCQVETGLTVQVPLFIEAGDKIIVDTRSGQYVERA